MSHDPNSTTNTTRTSDTYVEKSGGSGAIWFIVGGLVVAVAVIFYLFNGGDVPTATSGGGDLNVTVEGSDSSATSTEAPAEPAAEGSAEGGTEAATDSN